MSWAAIVDGALEIIGVSTKRLKVGVWGYREPGKSKFGCVFYS